MSDYLSPVVFFYILFSMLVEKDPKWSEFWPVTKSLPF